MKKIFLLIGLSVIVCSCKETKKVATVTDANKSNSTINSTAKIDSVVVKKHLYTLASDEMEGRGTGTPGIEKAAVYIENEFKRIGLKTFKDLTDYRQTFTFKIEEQEKTLLQVILLAF